MKGSLQDQLKKAGLVSDKKAKSINNEKYRQKKSAKKNKTEIVDQTKAEIEQEKQAKIERDRALNLERQKQAEEKAVIAQIHQLIESNRIPHMGDIAYHFDYEQKVKKLMVKEDCQRDLANGRLAIVLDKEQAFAVVPSKVAEKINQRNPSFIVSLHEQQIENDEDDPYADFEVPDDLMW